MSHLDDALAGVFQRLGFPAATGRDAVFQALVLVRIIEPSSKLDSLRVLEEAGLPAESYRTIKRRLPVYAKDEFQQRILAECAAHAGLGPASLVLYDKRPGSSPLSASLVGQSSPWRGKGDVHVRAPRHQARGTAWA